MYEGWRVERWVTPASDVDITMESLVDDGRLSVTVADGPRRWRFVFEKYPAYRNILEEYRLELWQRLDDSHQRCGSTFTVLDSPWLAELNAREPLLNVYCPQLFHFVICTSDDVIEILSPKPPQIEVM